MTLFEREDTGILKESAVAGWRTRYEEEAMKLTEDRLRNEC
jgi:hypothetical protein